LRTPFARLVDERGERVCFRCMSRGPMTVEGAAGLQIGKPIGRRDFEKA